MLLYQPLVSLCMEKYRKNSHKSNKFKISAPKCNEEFEILDVSYSVSDIQLYFRYIFEIHETVTDNPSIMK